MKEKILITGATGNYGGKTIDFLLQRGISPENIFGLARNRSKTEDLTKKGVHIRNGNYDDFDSLLKACKGIDKMLLVSGTDVENRVRQQLNVLKAAKEAGVNHIYYTSFERKNEKASSPIAAVAQAHLATEKALKEKGFTYTIFRNNIYMEMIPVMAGDQVTEKGIFLPAGETGVAFALRSEMAEASANAIAEGGHENREYAFSNPENISFSEIAAMISDITGKQVPYMDPSPELFRETLLKAGVPEHIVETTASFAEGMKQGEFHTGKSDLGKLLGRKPLSVQDFLTRIYG